MYSSWKQLTKYNIFPPLSLEQQQLASALSNSIELELNVDMLSHVVVSCKSRDIGIFLSLRTVTLFIGIVS